jgi:hypothetical protein
MVGIRYSGSIYCRNYDSEYDMKQTDWEYDKIFGDRQSGDVRKEYITYRRVGDKIKKITVIRIYYNDDYQDSVESVII